MRVALTRASPPMPTVSTTKPTTAPSTVAAPVTSTTARVRAVTRTTPVTRAPVRPRVTSPSVAVAAPAPLIDSIRELGSAEQVVTVTTSSWTASTATLQAFEKDGGAWRPVVGPTPAFVGVHGFAPPADKREGDGRTPAGIYAFESMFGTDTDPGVHFSYRVAGPPDVWVDDPGSALYNTWQQDPAAGRWTSAEQLDQPAPYAHAAVIGWNTARVPGRGSAIFFHVSLGHGTAGCVAVNDAVLVQVLRWLDPARQPVIAMGPDAYVRHL
jgi:L,D-peptidoglycan transpeptidase YkuD (ErfK/YbiS/YcfS/YnhG family)